jgi:hypothetical protein
MSDDHTDEVLDHIDAALDGAVWDPEVGGDAMRWVPETDRDGKDHLPEPDDDYPLVGTYGGIEFREAPGYPDEWPDPQGQWVPPPSLWVQINEQLAEAFSAELDRTILYGDGVPPCADVSLAGFEFRPEEVLDFRPIRPGDIAHAMGVPLPFPDPPRLVEQGRHTAVFEFRLSDEALTAFRQATERIGTALRDIGRAAGEALRALDGLATRLERDRAGRVLPRDYLAPGSGRQTPPPWAAPPTSRPWTSSPWEIDRHAASRRARSGPRR